MTATKNQIIKGVVDYANAEIITKISDKPLKIILAMFVSAIEVNHSISERIFNNEICSAILYETDGAYDIDAAFEIAEKAMNEYGDFSITIPAIKFVSPDEKQLTFSINDIKKLKQYIIKGES